MKRSTGHRGKKEEREGGGRRAYVLILDACIHLWSNVHITAGLHLHIFKIKESNEEARGS